VDKPVCYAGTYAGTGLQPVPERFGLETSAGGRKSPYHLQLRQLGQP
jgi:hypothetical protein